MRSRASAWSPRCASSGSASGVDWGDGAGDDFVDYQMGGMTAPSAMGWMFWRGIAFAVPAASSPRCRSITGCSSASLSNAIRPYCESIFGGLLRRDVYAFLRLLTLTALVVMPFGMSARAPGRRITRRGDGGRHCDEQGGRPAEDTAIACRCTASCSMFMAEIAPAQAPSRSGQSIVGPIAQRGRACRPRPQRHLRRT